MHYYKRNLGDYAKKAGRLCMLQHGAYTLLIDACYDRERFPTRDEAIDWTWASTTAEIEAVDFVLSKFFTCVDGFYVQDRIQEEIAAYHATSETNKRIATEREAKRKGLPTERARSVNEAPPNQEPRTNNQEPKEEKTPRKRSAPTPALPNPDDVDPQTWADFLIHRKAKSAPVTETVLKNARNEAAAAGMDLDAFLQVWCARGSQGLQADWLKPHERNTASRITQLSFAQQDELARRKRWEEMTGRQWPESGAAPDTFDAEDIAPKRIEK